MSDSQLTADEIATLTAPFAVPVRMRVGDAEERTVGFVSGPSRLPALLRDIADHIERSQGGDAMRSGPTDE